ncbi:MAG: ABC transporter permease [Candidatus Margulisbacteria bacterium]|nr:ABC transporter permease [Candidatus Margulisiibacteriota bacterium]MBU1021860.1 ABC transporter permease [Candidatus Margulisiibacteriota bacterium]MBU1729019.1 ABC transporter permease [Candidatus Margulisiibacteriota bacterium]MBU1954428.1 ABC transporter permease [Candidatus Margulisiibacteriota bacterium]
MFKIALRNIFRNLRRSILTGLSIAVAVMIAIYLWALITGVMDDMFDNMIRLTNGHVRILNSDYVKRERMLPLEANIPDYLAVEKVAAANPNVTLTAGRIKFGVLLEHEGNNKPVFGTGIVPETESQISHLDQKIVEGRMIRPGQEEMNIGINLAQDLGLKLGDTLTVITQTAYGSISAMNLKIVGIFSYGVQSIDKTTFYLPLDKAQQLLDLDNSVTEIFVFVKDKNKAPEVAKEIQAGLEQIYPSQYTTEAWQDIEILYFYMTIAKNVYGGLYFLVLFLASFTILNTMFMSVLERTKEIGMMKALGMKDRQVMGVVLLEATLIGTIASFIGALWGAGIAYYLAVVGIDFTATFKQMGTLNFPLSYVYRAIFSWGIVFFGFCMGILFSCVAAVPPALRAAKMEPTEALREI